MRLVSLNRLSFHLRALAFSPLPAKLDTGGEDAYVSTETIQSVLDGVSWWRDKRSVDAGVYSSAFAKHVHEYVEEELLGDNPPSSFSLLEHGYEETKSDNILGTATALVATLQCEQFPIKQRSGYTVVDLKRWREENIVSSIESGLDERGLEGAPDLGSAHHYLDVAFVGDCRLMIIRNGSILYQTEEQLHDVDFPFQLGRGSTDQPKDGISLLIPVQRGDIVVLGSDGLFDNVYTENICKLMWDAVKDCPFYRSAALASNNPFIQPPSRLQTLTQKLIGSPHALGSAPSASSTAKNRLQLFDETLAALNVGIESVTAQAINISQDIHADSPYATRCIEHGCNYVGGKPDDITVLASILEDEQTAVYAERVSEGTIFPPPYRDWP